MMQIPPSAGKPARHWFKTYTLWFIGSAAISTIVLLAGAKPPPGVPQSGAQLVAQEPTPGVEQTSLSTPVRSNMDEPLRLANLASQAYRDVTDYTCTLIKTERIKGQMQPENVINVKVRTDPFSVYFHWVEPRSIANQEAVFVTGKHKGMMRVKPHGFVGSIAGFTSIDPADPRAMEASHHKITEAGIGNLIERTVHGWDTDRRLNKTMVRLADFDFNGRHVTRVETKNPEDSAAQFQYYRTVIFFDKENHLPIRVENYDWPRKSINKDGDLLEMFSYVDLKLNVNLLPGTFDR